MIRFCLLLFLCQDPDPLQGTVTGIREERLREHVTFLASDELEGRGAGYPGNEKAAEYLAQQFEKAGVKPAGTDGSWFQEFALEGGLKTRNVVAILEGSDSKLKDEVVVIGAHFDHVGRIGQPFRGQSGTPLEGDEIWNGADDNASGTSVVLALAEALAASPVKPRRTVVFACWSAEEIGMFGSRHYAEQPPLPLNRHVFNLNLDMVGRNSNQAMGVEGVATSEGDAIAKLVEAAAAAESLVVAPYPFENEAMFRSDGATFLRRQIPAVMFFSHFHEDYHRVTDHAERIEYGHLLKVARVAARLVVGVANLDEVPVFNIDTPLPGAAGPRLGVNGRETDGGVQVTDVVRGSVADRAGIRVGDIIAAFDGAALERGRALLSLRQKVRESKAGSEHEVTLVRDGERTAVKVKW